MVAEGFEEGGEMVVVEGVGVAEDLEVGAVVVLEEGADVSADDVVAEVGGDVADAEGAGGCGMLRRGCIADVFGL